MAKSSKEATTRSQPDPGDYGVVRGVTRYDPAEWDFFEKFCEKNGLAPGTYIKKMIRDVIGGCIVALGGMKPETLAELKRFADDLSRVPPRRGAHRHRLLAHTPPGTRGHKEVA